MSHGSDEKLVVDSFSVIVGLLAILLGPYIEGRRRNFGGTIVVSYQASGCLLEEWKMEEDVLL